MKVTAKLTNWVYNKSANNIIGIIHNDVGNKNRGEKGFMYRFQNGERIYTSTIQEFLEEGKFVRTLNSIYELDPPFMEK